MELRTDVKTDLNWLSIHHSQENGSSEVIEALAPVQNLLLLKTQLIPSTVPYQESMISFSLDPTEYFMKLSS